MTASTWAPLTAKLLLTWALIYSLPSSAQFLRLRTTDYGWLTGFAGGEALFDAYLQTVENDLNEDFPIIDPVRLAEGVGNSTALAPRGLSSDYGNNRLKVWTAGLGVGAAADLKEDVAIDDEISGVGAATGLVVGLRGSEKWSFYGSIGGVSHARTFKGIGDSDLDVELTTFNLGTRARYDWIDGSGDDWLGWGGVKLHFGYDFSVNDIEFLDVLNEDLELDVGGVAVIQGRLKGVPRYLINSVTHSIPLELSSNVTFLKWFSLFGGTGLDFNFGRSKGRGDLKARVFSPLTCSSGICTNLNLPEVEASANLDAQKNVKQVFPRVFGGLQLNIGHFTMYTMINHVLDSQLVGLSTGFRIVY